MTRFYSALLGGVAVSALMSSVFPAGAQAQGEGGIPEIVVTAERRETKIQSTPVTISAFSSDKLEAVQARESSDLQNIVPGLTMVQGVGTPSKTDLFLRGAGDQTGGVILSESAVGLYLDDVYLPRLNVANIELLELERVEVLRGPQGTLYGRNSMTGAIKYISKTPDNTVGGSFGAGYGRFDEYFVQGHITGPIVADKLAASVSATYRNTGDWYRNSTLNEDRGARRVFGSHATLAFTGSDAFTAKANINYTREKNDGGEAVARSATTLDSVTGDFRTVRSPYNTFGDSETVLASLDAAYDFSSDVRLRSITAYQHIRDDFSFDLTGGYGTPGALNAYKRLAGLHENVFSEELQLLGTALDKQLEWIGGAYYFRESGFQAVTDTVGPAPTRAPTAFDLVTRSYAFFGQAKYHLSDKVSATAGLRYTHDDKNIVGSSGTVAAPTVGTALAAKNGWNAVTPRFVLDYQAQDNVFLFASVSRGYQAGSYNALASLDPVSLSTAYNPQKLWAYEAGVKSDLLDRRLRVNTNFFFNDFTDLQGLNTDSTGRTITANIADAHVYGLELEVTAQITDALQFFATVSRTWDKYTRISPTSAIATLTNLRMNRVSAWQSNAGITYKQPIAGFGFLGFNTDWSYRSDYFNDINNAPATLTKGYHTVNAGVFYETSDEKWTVTFAGRNIFDSKTYLKGLAVIQPSGYPNKPPSWLLSAKAKF